MRKAALILSLCFMLINALAQDQLKTVLDKFESAQSKLPQEKVHIHFDKPYYTIGDTIWMKAYVVSAENNQPSELSKILYVELIDEQDSVKSTLRLPVSTGRALGDFTLAETLREGNYRIRAYTNWMRNFAEEFFFYRNVPVGNSLSKLITNTNYTFMQNGNEETVVADIRYSSSDQTPLAGKEINYDVQLDSKSILKGKGTTDDKGNLKITFVNSKADAVRSGIIITDLKIDKKEVSKIIPVSFNQDLAELSFFPESGQLVSGLRSKVAFKALGSNGLGTAVSGYVVDQSGNNVTAFQSVNAGMGAFFLVPVAGNTYTAIVKFGDSEKRYKLPEAKAEGYVLSVTRGDTASLFVEVAASPQMATAGSATLVAQQNGVVQNSVIVPMKQAITKFRLSKGELSTGILQLTLFSPQYKPLAERLVFVQKNDQLAIIASADKPVYAAREKVKIYLTTKDAAGNSVAGNFSMAVTEVTKVPADEANEITILSNLLLSSDLKGYIEKPNYYFTPGPNKEAHLDNLMLSQGWRRFIWEDVLADKLPALTFNVEQGIPVSGKLVTPTGRALANGKVSLIFNSGLMIDTISNDKGEFRFKDQDVSNGFEFHMMAEDSKGNKDIKVLLDKTSIQQITVNYPLPSGDEINSLKTYLESSKPRLDDIKFRESIALKEVVITKVLTPREKLIKVAVQGSRNRLGPGEANQVFTFVDIGKFCVSLYGCLVGKIRGVNIAPNGAVGLKVYLDGTFVGGDINIVPPNMVASVEIIRGARAVVYGGDAIVITTKQGGVDYLALEEEYLGINTTGKQIKSDKPSQYYFGRQFYSPNYSISKNTHIADLRTTVYWNPDITSELDGKASVEFFTSDAPGTYRAVIEGLDFSGNLGRKVFTYTVK